MRKGSGNFTWSAFTTSVSQFVVLIFGMSSSIIIARVLGPEGKGFYTIALLFLSTLVYFSSLGLGQAQIYFLGKKKYPGKEVIGHSLIYLFILSVLVIITGLLIVFLFGEKIFPGVPAKILIFAIFMVPSQLFYGFLTQALQGLQEFRLLNLIIICRMALLLALVGFLLLWVGLDVRAVLLSEMISFAFTGTIVFLLVQRRLGGISLRLNMQYIKESLKYGITSYSGSLLTFIHYRLDLFLINLFLSPVMVGFYSVSVGLSERLSMISEGIATVLFPKVASEPDADKVNEFTPLVLRSVMLFVAIIAFSLALLGPWLITTFYTGAFMKSVLPFQVLLLGTVLLSGWSILDSDFKGRGKPLMSTLTTGIAIFVNLVLNLILLPRYSILGAAIASLISYGVAFISALVIYCRLSNNNPVGVLLLRRSDFVVYKYLAIRLATTFSKSGSN